MMKLEVAFLSLLLILGLAFCGQSLARDTKSPSEEEDLTAEEEVTPEGEIAPEEELAPEEEIAPEEGVHLEDVVNPKADTTSEAEVTPTEEEAVPAEAGPTPPKEMTREELLETLIEVHGKRDRREFRAAYWVAGLEGDKKEIYDTYGNPSNRYREDRAGAVVERWIYAEDGKQFIFRDNKLTSTRTFKPGTTP